MSILMLSIIIQVATFGHNSLQMTYFLVQMVNQSICNTLGSLFYLLFNMLGRDSGSFKYFPHDIQTGGTGWGPPYLVQYHSTNSL